MPSPEPGWGEGEVEGGLIVAVQTQMTEGPVCTKPPPPCSTLTIPSELMYGTMSQCCHRFSLLVPQSAWKVPPCVVVHYFYWDINYFSWNLVKYFLQFSYFIIVAVTLWPLYLQPVILQNGEKTLCSSFDVWFSWQYMLFLLFHSFLQCPVLNVCYTTFISINHFI